MRIEKSIYNVSSNIFIYAFRSIMMFVVRTIFIKVLGENLLGLDGLFTNILLMLSMAELGISNAINYSLYKPLAQNDTKKISSLMSLYRKIYKAVGFFVLIIGLIVMLFLDHFIDNIPGVNIRLIYLIYLFDTVSMYFISYKETLIIADQNNYKLTKFNFIFYLIMYILQILDLIYLKNFILYLIIKIVVMFLQRIFINVYITNNYKNVDFYSEEKVNDKDIKEIKTKVSAMFCHKIGNYVINGTDNIVISKFINIATVGIYTNYLSVITMTNTLISGFYKGITASFGNLIVSEKENVQQDVFIKINFLGHIIYGLVSIGFAILINDFILLWIGEKFLLSKVVVLIVCFNFYLDGIRQCIDSIKESAGAYDKDKYIPIFQSLLNIIISIVLVKKIGIVGVVLGTLISNLLLPCWNRPYIIYKYIFKSSPKKYYKDYILNILFILLSYILLNKLIIYINLTKNIVSFIINFIIVVVGYVALILIFYGRGENYRFYKNLFIGKIKKEK